MPAEAVHVADAAGGMPAPLPAGLSKLHNASTQQVLGHHHALPHLRGRTASFASCALTAVQSYSSARPVQRVDGLHPHPGVKALGHLRLHSQHL